MPNKKYITCKVGDKVLCYKGIWATSLWQRTKGLMFSSGLGDQYVLDGMLIDYCNSVHTFFMRFPLDLIFLDKSNTVLAVVENKKPWRMTKVYWKATKVLELPIGKANGVKLGDYLEVSDV